MQKRERTSHCPVAGCDYLSYSVHGIACHVRHAHSGYSPLEKGLHCPVCGQERTGMNAMVTHIEMTHAFEDFENPTADYTLHEGLLRFLDYEGKLRTFERLYPESEAA